MLSCSATSGVLVLFVINQSHKVRVSHFFLHTASGDVIDGQSTISEDVVCVEADHLPTIFTNEFLERREDECTNNIDGRTPAKRRWLEKEKDYQSEDGRRSLDVPLAMARIS